MKTRNLKTKTLSILLAMVMLLGMLPMSVFAAETEDKVITLTPADLVSGASGEGWSFSGAQLTIESGYTLNFEGECPVYVVNNGTISGGTFSGGVENDGTITDGIFNGVYTVLSLGTIGNGIFNVFVHNRGTIEDGTFNNQVENYMGTIRGGSFYASVKNTAIGATIAGGSFHGDVTNYRTITGGTFSGKLTNNQGSISGITIELSNALIQGGESYGWSLDADNDLILNSGITYYWKDGEVCNNWVNNNGTITGGSFGGRVHSWGTITGGTFSDQVDNDGTITDGTFNGEHCFNHESGTITGGTFSSYVENNGTITGGTFSSYVDNDGTISGGVFTGGMRNYGTVTGTVDLSTLESFVDHSGQYGKQVKLPKAVIRGDLTYTGCESSTEITLEYYADDVKTAEWTVSGEKYSYPVEKYKRSNPDADLSGIEEITHEVKAISMDGYDITIDHPIWDRFHVTVRHIHNYGTEWKSDGSDHWHECSCGAKADSAAHTYGNWKVVKAATTTAKGKEERTCSACGHVESRDIPMISDNPQTGDESNLLLWGAVMLVSVLGMVALLAESKRRISAK